MLLAFIAPKLSSAAASVLLGAYSSDSASSVSSMKTAFRDATASLSVAEMFPSGTMPFSQRLSKTLGKFNARLARVSVRDCAAAKKAIVSDAVMLKNNKPDLVLVSYDTTNAADSDACVGELLQAAASATDNSYVALFTAEGADDIQTMFPAADSSESPVLLESHVQVMSTAGVGPLYISPAILFGLMFGLFFIVTALIGLCCMDSIQTPLRFPTRKVNWGKEV